MRKINNIDFGERLKKLRELKGLTKSDLAKFLKVSYKTITRWEKGETVPSILELKEIAKILEVPEDYLLGKTDIFVATNSIESKIKRLPPEARGELENILDYLYYKYKRRGK